LITTVLPAQYASAPCGPSLLIPWATSSGIRGSYFIYLDIAPPLDGLSKSYQHSRATYHKSARPRYKNKHFFKHTQTTSTMFSCVNYERGCRGRCNASNGRCDSCVTLNLQSRNNSSSSVSSTSSSKSQTAAYSAMTSSFASLSQLSNNSRRGS